MDKNLEVEVAATDTQSSFCDPKQEYSQCALKITVGCRTRRSALTRRCGGMYAAISRVGPKMEVREQQARRWLFGLLRLVPNVER